MRTIENRSSIKIPRVKQQRQQATAGLIKKKKIINNLASAANAITNTFNLLLRQTWSTVLFVDIQLHSTIGRPWEVERTSGWYPKELGQARHQYVSIGLRCYHCNSIEHVVDNDQVLPSYAILCCTFKRVLATEGLSSIIYFECHE